MIPSTFKDAFSDRIRRSDYIAKVAVGLLCLLVVNSIAWQPEPASGQPIPDSVAAQNGNIYFPVFQGANLPTHQGSIPAVYDPQRSAYVTNLVDLEPYEVQRWGRGLISNVAYLPTGDLGLCQDEVHQVESREVAKKKELLPDERDQLYHISVVCVGCSGPAQQKGMSF